jgi:hypothetical protein
MALSTKKKRDIKKEALSLSQNVPLSESVAFQRDYEDIMINLNFSLENRIDDFQNEVIPILREAYPTRPNAILSVIKEESERLRDLTQSILTNLETIKYPAFRESAAECIKDLVDICTKSICEQHKRASIRSKVKEQ